MDKCYRYLNESNIETGLNEIAEKIKQKGIQ